MIYAIAAIFFGAWINARHHLRIERRISSKLAARARNAETRADVAEYVAREVAKVHRETVMGAMELERIVAVRRGDVVGVN